MNRYKILTGVAKDPEVPEDVPQQIRNQGIIQPMEVQIRFEPHGAFWYISVRKDNKKDWFTVTEEVSLGGSYTSTDTVKFKNRSEAEDYCQKKGLV